jgi:hypothetical protein
MGKDEDSILDCMRHRCAVRGRCAPIRDARLRGIPTPTGAGDRPVTVISASRRVTGNGSMLGFLLFCASSLGLLFALGRSTGRARLAVRRASVPRPIPRSRPRAARCQSPRSSPAISSTAWDRLASGSCPGARQPHRSFGAEWHSAKLRSACFPAIRGWLDHCR